MLSPNNFLAQHKQALLLVVGSFQNQYPFPKTYTLLKTKAHKDLKPRILIKWLAETVKLNCPSNEPSQKDCLNYFLKQVKTCNKKFLLVIESAEHLPLSTLAALSHLAITQEKTNIVMPIFLTGDESLVEKAQRLQIKPIPNIILNKQPIDSGMVEKNDPFWKQHAVKSIALTLLVIFGFGAHYFKQHHTYQHPSRLITQKKTTEPSQVITLGPDVVIREASTKTHENHYTIQLAAVKKYKNATKYIQHYHLKNATIHSKKVKNNDWFVVNYGNFSSKKAAQSAEKQLPDNLSKHLWITKKTT